MEHTYEEQGQIIFVDGCKVTIRYGTEKNETVMQEIRNILSTGIGKKSLAVEQ